MITDEARGRENYALRKWDRFSDGKGFKVCEVRSCQRDQREVKRLCVACMHQLQRYLPALVLRCA